MFVHNAFFYDNDNNNHHHYDHNIQYGIRNSLFRALYNLRWWRSILLRSYDVSELFTSRVCICSFVREWFGGMCQGAITHSRSRTINIRLLPAAWAFPVFQNWGTGGFKSFVTGQIPQEAETYLQLHAYDVVVLPGTPYDLNCRCTR